MVPYETDSHPLLDHLEAVQATESVLRRIRTVLDIETDDILSWCRDRMVDPESLTSTSDCWHVRWDGAVLSVRITDLQIVSVRREKSKKGSDLSDVNLVGKLEDWAEGKATLVAAFDHKTHRRVSRYGERLAVHVLDMAGMQMDAPLEACCTVIRRWRAGAAHFQEARDMAFEMHELARVESDPLREKALRTMGQIAAIPHVKRHALIASDYAVKVVNLLHPGDREAVRAEREWQIRVMEAV